MNIFRLHKSILFFLLVAPLSLVANTTSTPSDADAEAEQAELSERKNSALMNVLEEKRFGDLPKLLESRQIRVLLTHNRTDYLVEKGRQTGILYDSLVALEAQLNYQMNKGKPKKRHLPYRIVVIPVSEANLIPYLEAGLGDIAASTIIDTPELRTKVDLTDPYYSEAKEIVVTHKGVSSGAIEDDLSGKTIFVRKSSSAYQSLQSLNSRLTAKGLAPVNIEIADDHFADDELMEMVNANMIPATVTNLFRAKVWSKVFTNLELNQKYTLRDHEHVVWAVRKQSPQLLSFLNRFVSTHKVGTTFGNTLYNHYFANPNFAKNAINADGRQRFGSLVEFFKKYAGQYDFDYLLLMAQGYQESGLNQNAKSHVGAIGVMQVMPATGRELKVGDIHKTDPNIHAGTKYIHLMRDRYFNDPAIDEINRMYFAFAAYNAGPGNVIKMRKLAKKQGLDANIWFDNVELVMLQHIGREPVQYVSNISKYYLAYKLLEREKTASTPTESAPKSN